MSRCCARGRKPYLSGRQRACCWRRSKGKGYSLIDGERYDWDQFDTLAIPGGCWVEHVNPSDKDPVILFGATDAPTQKSLLLYKRWGRNQAGDLLRLA